MRLVCALPFSCTGLEIRSLRSCVSVGSLFGCALIFGIHIKETVQMQTVAVGTYTLPLSPLQNHHCVKRIRSCRSPSRVPLPGKTLIAVGLHRCSLSRCLTESKPLQWRVRSIFLITLYLSVSLHIQKNPCLHYTPTTGRFSICLLFVKGGGLTEKKPFSFSIFGLSFYSLFPFLYFRIASPCHRASAYTPEKRCACCRTLK